MGRHNCQIQILANNSHNRNTMHASRLTQFVFVTLYAFLTVLFVAMNRDFLETKLELINQLSIINELNFPPRGNLFISIVRIWAKTNEFVNDL